MWTIARIPMLVALLAVAGCVNVTPITMPDGKPGYSISCPPREAGTMCLQKAGELCPAGYQVAGSGGTFQSYAYGNGQFFSAGAFNRPQLVIECRQS